MNELIITQPDELQRLVSDAVSKAVSGLSSDRKTQEKEVFSNRDAMKFLGVSRSTLQRWREDGILPYRKVNGTILYTKADLLEMLENNKG